MSGRAAVGKPLTAMRGVRSGRPPRELAGAVDERILDAAKKVFLERGFEGASIDEIAEVARAGNPRSTPGIKGKEALFAAVMARKVRDNISAFESIVPEGDTLEERLASIAAAILDHVLAADTVRLCRVTIAEAPRFHELAASVHRMARERTSEAVARLLEGLPEGEQLPGLAAGRRTASARQFVELIVLPMLMRALFGEDLSTLRAEIAPWVSDNVAFFLIACRQ